MSRRRTRTSGAAVVELAILLLAVLPTLFAALFLADALRFKLDVEEAVISTAWDHATARFDGDADGLSPDETAARIAFDAHARKALCDHTLAFGHEQASRDCTDRVDLHHRTTLAAKMLWGGESGRWEDRGVRCSLRRDAGRHPGAVVSLPHLLETPLAIADRYYGHGGRFSCEATGWLYDTFVPGVLFPEFGDGRLVDEEKLARIEAEGGQALRLSQAAPHLALTHRFGILADTWASSDGRDRPLDTACESALSGKAGHGVYRRILALWSGGGALPSNASYQRFLTVYGAFAIAAGKEELVLVRPPSACTEGGTLSTVIAAALGTDPSVLVASLRHPRAGDEPGPGKETLRRPFELLGGAPEDAFFTSPWDVEGVPDRGYAATFQNRGRHYLGCSRPGEC